MYIRHLSLMISWVRSELMVKPEFDSVATKRFADRECAVLLSTSGNLGYFKDAKKLDFSISGLPYYPEVAKKPGNPFVGGRSEEHTSELQSLMRISYAVFCLKKKTKMLRYK